MPTYDYCCGKCDKTFEVVHRISEKPDVACPACGSPARKVPSLCSISHGSTREQRRYNDRFRREGAMRMEMKERFGIEKVRPLGGKSVADVYADVKSRPGFVQEEMARSAAESSRKTKEKQREWKRKAVRRATPRRLEMERRKAADDYAKRAVSI